MATRQLLLPTGGSPVRLGRPALKPHQYDSAVAPAAWWPALKPNQIRQAVPPVQVARAQKAARKADAPASQADRRRKLVPGQVFIPGMGGDPSFSGSLGTPVSVL